MKKLQSFVLNSDRHEAFRTSALATLVALLAATFWLVASPSAMAQKGEPQVDEGADCTVCHKNRQTIVLPCNSVALRRHQAHGDFNGPCPGTPGSREE